MKKETKASSNNPLAQMGPFSGLLRDERGVVAVMVALLFVVILGFTALVIDLGWLFIVNSELQNGADAGALAGVVELVLSDASTAENTAVTYATELSQYRLNNPAPKRDAVTVTIGGVLGPETLQVQIRRDSDTTAGAVPTMFARAWGKDTMTTDVIAVATLDRRIIGSGPGNLIPFAIRDTSLVDNDGDSFPEPMNIYPKDFAQAQFGVVDFDGGNNSQQDVKDWIEYGYDDYFTIPQDGCQCIYLEGDPGIRGGSMDPSIASRIGDIVLMPVFTEMIDLEGPTSQNKYKVVDFVGGIITGFKLNGPQEGRYLNITFVNFSASNLITDNGAGLNPTVSKPVLIR